MATQSYPYNVPGDYTYDSNKIEVSGGIAKLLEDFTNVYALWHLNESTGIVAADSSGNNRNGTTVNLLNTDWVTGHLNNGLQFNAVDNEYVDCGDIADFSFDDAFSFELWVYAASVGRKRVLLARGTDADGIELSIEPTGDLTYALRDTASTRAIRKTVDTLLSDSAWHHVLVSYDGSRSAAGMIIWVDGVQPTVLSSQDNITGAGSLTVATTFQIGAQSTLNTFREGILDEVAVYSDVRDNNYVAYRYNAGTGREEVFYYADHPSIEPTALFNPGDAVQWDAFLQTTGGGHQGIIGYNLYKVDKLTNWYWNGSAWAAGGSSTLYNQVGVINSNILTFDLTPTSIGFVAYFVSDGTQRVELDLNQVTYSVGVAPIVNAGADKGVFDNQYLAPFSDAVFSDPDGTIVTAEYQVSGEVDVWTEIEQGAFATLLDAVQTFQYQFNNPGVLTVQLRVTDNDSLMQTDSLQVTVSRYTKTIEIRDAITNDHLENVEFDPGDGSGFIVYSSPFQYIWDYGTYDWIVRKAGYNDYTEAKLIENELTVTILMRKITSTQFVQAAFGFLDTSDAFVVNVWLQVEGNLVLTPTSATIELYNNAHTLVWSPATSTSSSALGIFRFELTPSGFPDEQVYYIRATIVHNSISYETIVPVGAIRRDITYPLLQTVDGKVDTLDSKMDIVDANVDSVLAYAERITGLTQENFILDTAVYDTESNLTSARMRIFPSAADAEAETNVLATYTVTAVYNIAGQLTNYKVVKA